jgi:hypothetical protein
MAGGFHQRTGTKKVRCLNILEGPLEEVSRLL